ncbi:hypothetical protein ES703_122871 [subsurface metagenome]
MEYRWLHLEWYIHQAHLEVTTEIMNLEIDRSAASLWNLNINLAGAYAQADS